MSYWLRVLLFRLMMSGLWSTSSVQGQNTQLFGEAGWNNHFIEASEERQSIWSDVQYNLELAQEERRRILEEVQSLASRSTPTLRPDTPLEECGLRWANVAEFSSHKYLLGLDRVTWMEAREKCARCGYSLAKIDSRDESDFIKSWFAATGVHQLAPRSTTGVRLVWTDGTDLGHESCWVWTHPQVAPLSVHEDLWHPGEPNNGYDNENCAGLWSEAQWNMADGVCTWLLSYLCEKTPGEVDEMPSMDQVTNTTHCTP